ncbi:MAG TPA: chemotaxis-specific protein-glutamate methyltransferase CheB [Terricaulis sp.]|nr:chemotaxis-specific protein-glutamate methyltransferase CheB [Terricaulis sp.]
MAINVLVVDDSAVVRGMISRAIAADPGIRVIGAAGDGAAALVLVKANHPDVVLLDVEMPVMDGLKALPQILAARPGVAVIMASALTRRHAGMSLCALRLGAADYVPKPDAGNDNLPAFYEELIAKIKAHAPRPAPAPTPTPPQAPIWRFTPKAVAIGCSTGGPPALLKVFAKAKGAIRIPVFVTQHMPATFTAILAEQIGQVCGARTFEAREGMAVEAGCVYVAPGGRHLVAARAGEGIVMHLADTPPENFCKPAVDPMLRSLAQVYGAGLLAAILTGMGRDGAEGCLAVANAGGRFFVQDEASSVVWGMPGAAFKTGRAMGQLSLDAAIDYLAAAMRGRP